MAARLPMYTCQTYPSKWLSHACARDPTRYLRRGGQFNIRVYIYTYICICVYIEICHCLCCSVAWNLFSTDQGNNVAAFGLHICTYFANSELVTIWAYRGHIKIPKSSPDTFFCAESDVDAKSWQLHTKTCQLTSAGVSEAMMRAGRG